MRAQHALHRGPLNAAAASVDEAQLEDPGLAARPHVLLDHRGHVTGREGVEVKLAGEGQAHGLVGKVVAHMGRLPAAAAKNAGRYSESPSSRRLYAFPIGSHAEPPGSTITIGQGDTSA